MNIKEDILKNTDLIIKEEIHNEKIYKEIYNNINILLKNLSILKEIYEFESTLKMTKNKYENLKNAIKSLPDEEEYFRKAQDDLSLNSPKEMYKLQQLKKVLAETNFKISPFIKEINKNDDLGRIRDLKNLK